MARPGRKTPGDLAQHAPDEIALAVGGEADKDASAIEVGSELVDATAAGEVVEKGAPHAFAPGPRAGRARKDAHEGYGLGVGAPAPRRRLRGEIHGAHSTPSLAARIAAAEAELDRLRTLHRLAGVIVATVPAGVAFSAAELFDYRNIDPALHLALTDAAIASPRALGHTLRSLCGCGLVRIGVDEHGAIWTVAESGHALP